MDSIPQRQCTGCKEFKPATNEYFSPNQRVKSGLQARCKLCCTEWQLEYRAQSPDRVKASESKRDREKRKSQARIRLQNPVYRESVNAKKRMEYAANPEPLKQYLKKYRKQFPDKVRAMMKRWVENNPDKVKAHGKKGNHMRRVRAMQAEGKFTVQDMNRIYSEQDGQCSYCGIRVFMDIPHDLHIDHAQPLSRGGTNWPDNLNISCEWCNCSKADKTVLEWMAIRGW